jgi:DNA-binding GntR family transcriptional regulator
MEEITHGRVMPGERLTESDLAERFNVSRSPIREALRQLESDGLIKLNQNKGITVSKLSISEIKEIYDLRWLLEGYATRLSAERSTKKDVTYLQALDKKMKRAAKAYHLSDWLENNSLFHNFCVEHSGNANLNRMVESIKRRVFHYKYVTARIPGHFEEYIVQHEGVLKGFCANDGEMAERHMKLHIRAIQKVLIEFLDQLPGF